MQEQSAKMALEEKLLVEQSKNNQLQLELERLKSYAKSMQEKTEKNPEKSSG